MGNSTRGSEIAGFHPDARFRGIEPFQSNVGGIDQCHPHTCFRYVIRPERHHKAEQPPRFKDFVVGFGKEVVGSFNHELDYIWRERYIAAYRFLP